MGCCSTAQTNHQLQFHGMDIYKSQLSLKNGQNKVSKSTDLSEHAHNYKVISQMSSDRSIIGGNRSQVLVGNANSVENTKGDLDLAQTWPILQLQPVQNQRQSAELDLKNRGMTKRVTFNEPPTHQRPLKVFSFSQNAYPRIRFGPLTTINQQESMVETVKLSELGSRAELNNTQRSIFPE